MPDPPPDQSFEPDLPEPSDEEIDEWLAEWEEADRHAAGVLRQALADHLGDSVPEAALVQAGVRLRHGLRSDGHPLAWVRRAAGLTDVELTASDEKLLVRCVAATISPVEETGLEPDEEATIISLEHADWLGAIISAVRSGPGSWAAASDLAAGVDSCPEVNTAGNVDDDSEIAELAFELVLLPWSAMGLIDDGRLTRLGAWALPRGLARAWGSSLDRPDA